MLTLIANQFKTNGIFSKIKIINRLNTQNIDEIHLFILFVSILVLI